MTEENIDYAIETQHLKLFYGKKQALFDISLSIKAKKITTVIGPSGCGKSTLLKCFNRLNDLVVNCKIQGKVFIGGDNVYDRAVNVAQLRRRVGIVYRKPNPFPKSIYENVVYGLRFQGVRDQCVLDELAEKSLTTVNLWDEVKDKLHDNALSLTDVQQQRLVLARAIALEPEVLLLDETASELDPISTLKIEELLFDLREIYTIILVTHNMQQAARVSDDTAFIDRGRLIEFSDTTTFFTNPQFEQTEDYITGRNG